MTRTRLQVSYILCFMLAIHSIPVNAGSCNEITNTINDDITKYADNIKNQHLPWMNTTWLQQQLGPANTKSIINGKIHYEWRCKNEDGFLDIDTDNNENLLSVSGQYNSNNGSGLFETQLPQRKSEQDLDHMISQLKAAPPQILQAESPPVSQEESNCKNIIGEIRSDLSKYSNSAQNQHLPWMSISWLKQEIGQPQTTTTYDYVYKWPNYSMFIGADGSTAEFGTLPNGIHSQTYTNVSAILGRPKKTLFEKLTVSNWECPEGNSSTLSILSGNNAIVTSIMGKDCSEDKCQNFFSPLAGSELKRKFAQQILQQTQVNAAVLATKLKNYNDKYKTTFINQEELDTDITLKIKNYYSSIRKCRPGIYLYALPVLQDFLYNTAIINPQKDGHCIVNTSYIIPQIGKVDLKCNYQSQSLQLFTDAEAIAAMNGTTKLANDHPSELQKAISKECKRYIDGVL